MALLPLPPTPNVRPMPDPNLCVLIDFENIAAGTEKAQLGKFNIRSVMDRLKERGRILIARAYGDWGRFAKFKQDLLREGIAMMELTSYRGQDKNRADIALVVDAMELAFTREHIDTYVLLSGDSDFTPLVMKLKEFNKKVIGVGTRQSTSRLLSAACDEFIFYENIRRGRMESDSSSEEEDAVNLSKVEVFAKLVETLEGLVRDTSGPVSSGVLKQSLLRKLPTFDEAEFGFTGFARFLENAHTKGLISIHTDSRAGGYLVALADNAPVSETPVDINLPKLSPEAEKLRDILITHKANPGTHLMRHVLVHELVDHVQERAARKKRNTLFYLYGDMNRRCRKTDPVVPAEIVKSIIDALHASGAILHPDGNPVRSPKANFVLQHEADEILSKLREHYLQTLLNAGEKLTDSTVLSELLWGDADHQQEVEEVLSWLIRNSEAAPEVVPAQPAVPQPTIPEQAPLPFESTQEEAIDSAEPPLPEAKQPKKKPRTRRSKRTAPNATDMTETIKRDDSFGPKDAEQAKEAPTEPPPEKPNRRTKSKATQSKAKTETNSTAETSTIAETSSGSEATQAEAVKPKKSTRTRRKKTETLTSDEPKSESKPKHQSLEKTAEKKDGP